MTNEAEQRKSTPQGLTELVVFEIVRSSTCAECGAALEPGAYLRLERERPLCLACADLDHLIYLPRGNTALTRRARKNSRLSAVVVRFSRARKRYERQGVLIEEAALEQAEEQCAADEDERKAMRCRASAYRARQDEALVVNMAESIRAMFPGCPAEEALRIAAHAAVRGSGRIGRSDAGRHLHPDALRLAVVAAIRHRQTNYDELLMGGLARYEAREAVRDRIAEVLERWSSPDRN